MCGIVGYIGEKNAETILINGLKKLEYRGYDSAGIAVITEGSVESAKKAGELQYLEELLKDNPLKGNIGIGHTRWATHGGPSDKNAHPHLSPSKKFAIVHNGIIENFQELKQEYLNNHKFLSETDTEVVAHLLEVFDTGDLETTVQKVLSLVEGSYALVVISKTEKDKIVVSRKDSPLVIGLGEGENFIASDVPALLAHTRKCIYLESDQMAILTKERVVIKDKLGNEVAMPIDEILWDEESAEKGGYDHFMIKEIDEQPVAFQRTLKGRIYNGKVVLDELHFTKEALENFKSIYIVACGTAYHAGLVGKTYLEKTLKLPVFVEVASEFRYRDPMLNHESLVILISQSGETADTMAALREAKHKGAKTLAITNVVGSAISREADEVTYLYAGPEISVASTKAYTTMLISLSLVALYLGDKVGRFDLTKNQEWLNSLENLPLFAERLLEAERIEKIEAISKKLSKVEHLFYIGRGLDWSTAQEGALKLKEISYIHAEAYAAGELKHGTLALITEKTPVIGIALQESTFDKTMSNVQEVMARGAEVTLLLEEDKHVKEKAEFVFVPKAHDMVMPILSAIPLQLIAYYTAKIRGEAIDKPRNLAKSVTVE